MALYNAKCSACCRGVVYLVSVLIGVLGLLVLAFGAMQTDYLPPASNYINVDIAKSGFGLAVVFLGLASLFIALLGWCTAKTKNCLVSTLFIVITFIMGVAFLVIGVVMGASVNDGIFEKLKSASCSKAVMLREEYMMAIDKVACSNECPCPKGDTGQYQTMWDAYGNDTLRMFNRTPSGETYLTSFE